MNRDDSDGSNSDGSNSSSSNDGEHDHFGSECSSDDEALAAVGELMCAVKKIIVYLFP